MREPKTIYVVDPGEPVRRKPTSPRSQSSNPQSSGKRVAGGTVSTGGKNPPRFSARVHLILAYMMGPLGLIITRRGRKDRFWLGAGIAAVPGLAAIILKGGAVKSGSPEILFWVGASLLLAFFWLTAWARAVHFAGDEGMFITRLQPKWLCRTWVMALISLLAPGLGLQFAGRPKRGAAAFWMTLAIVFPALILGNAARLWHWGLPAAAGRALESLFLGAGLLAFACVLFWIIQALDGARITSRASTDVPRTDAVAVVMLAVLLAFPFSFQPGTMAGSLDGLAQKFDGQGFQIIPLYLSLAAMKLDPSRPNYVLNAAAYYEQLGNPNASERLQSYLSERWKPYAAMVQKTTHGGHHGLVQPDLPQPLPSYPATWEKIQAIYGEDLLGGLIRSSSPKDL